jgi:hypothetical protein
VLLPQTLHPQILALPLRIQTCLSHPVTTDVLAPTLVPFRRKNFNEKKYQLFLLALFAPVLVVGYGTEWKEEEKREKEGEKE